MGKKRPVKGHETTETLDEIRSQLERLNETLEDLQSDIQWALRNIVHHVANAEAQPAAPTPSQSIDRQESILLRDLLFAPELDQDSVSDSTRELLHEIIEKLQPSRARKDQSPAAAAAEPSSAAGATEREDGHLF